MLISNAVDHALDKVDFQPFAGRAVYLEEKYVDCIDKNYVIASIRHRLMNTGATLVDAADAAEIVVEPRTGAVGTVSSESFVGVPEIALPGVVTLPEVRLLTRTRQSGSAKVGLVAYDAKSKQPLGPGGQSLASSDNSNWFVVGVGPYRSGTLKQEEIQATSGRAAWRRETVPKFVTFSSPSSVNTEPNRIQFTGGSDPQPAAGQEDVSAAKVVVESEESKEDGDAPWAE